MVMAMTVTVFAEPVEKNLRVKAVDGHTYTAYQLFVGDLAADGETLSNVKWGTNVASSITYTVNNESKTISTKAGDPVPEEVLTYLASLSGSNDETGEVAQATANIISSWVTSTGGTVIPDEGTDVDPGYYVVADAYTNPNDTQTTTLSTVVCKVVGPTEIVPKAGTTEHKKEVLDVNDTTEAALDLDALQNVATGWDKSADHDFGDNVPFKLTTKIGSDFAKYDSYVLKISDTMCNGLTLDKTSIKVYVNGDLATEGTDTDEDVNAGKYTLTTTDHSFEVAFTKLNGNTSAAAGRDVVVVYTATLNLDGTDVVIGNPGNPNTSYAEFSNNPNGDQSGTAETPKSTAVVFTYKTDVDKIDPDGNALPNAGFTLYKKYKAEVKGDKPNVAGTIPAGAKADTFPKDEFWYEVKTIAATPAGTSFEFAGIDDGTYILVESTTPNGYNTMDPVTLGVSATHGADGMSSTGYSVSVLDAGNNDFKADAKGGEVKFTKVNKEEKTLATGEIYSEIVNKAGSTLPETGGIGTTIFYVLGGILVVAAAILLVTKKRMSAEK